MWTLLTIVVTVAAVGYVAYKYPATWNWLVKTGAEKVNDAIDSVKK